MSRDFDGVDDLINYGVNDTFMRENQAMSGVVWVLREGTGGSTLFRRLGGAGQVSAVINSTSAGLFRFVVGGATNLDVVSATSSIANVWQCFAVTWNGTVTATNVKLYSNFVEMAYVLQQNMSLPNDNSPAALTLGNNAALTSDFDGQLAYLQIFNRVISLNEIRQCGYAPGSVRDELVAFLPLWGGAREGDYSTTRLSGTVTGTTVGVNNPPVSTVATIPSPMGFMVC